MSMLLQMSRTLKAFTDGGEMSFHAAQKRLDDVNVAIVVDDRARATAAGQAAALTALATGVRSFGNAALVTSRDAVLKRPIASGSTLVSAATAIGATVTTRMPEHVTHSILVADGEPRGFSVRCWWDGWLGGVVPASDARALGEGWNPLTGSFAGAVAVRELFAQARGLRSNHPRPCVVSLWEPWTDSLQHDRGPSTVYLPCAMWLVGLGHVGQGFLWNLGLLPGHGERLILQDAQDVAAENVATQILSSMPDIGKRKARIAARWMEACGWRTELIERAFSAGERRRDADPALIVSGVDRLDPRLQILAAHFPFMLDIGVGHGPGDFENLQLRVLSKGAESSWAEAAEDSKVSALLQSQAYRELAKSDPCGAYSVAQSSVAVPYVGAASGALAVAQALRIGQMQDTVSLLQVQLASPEMTSASRVRSTMSSGIGSVEIDLVAGERRLIASS